MEETINNTIDWILLVAWAVGGGLIGLGLGIQVVLWYTRPRWMGLNQRRGTSPAHMRWWLGL